MPTEYRRNRKRWGYRVCRAGINYKKFAWHTKAEAKQAEAEFLSELKNNPAPPKNSMTALCAAYLIDSAAKRSQWRVDALRWNFAKWVLPHFGENTLASAVKFDDVERFVLAQRRRGVSNKTVWNLVVDVRALFNWALKRGLVRTNPVNKADLSVIKNRKPKKAALDLNEIDFAASLLDGYDRAYFDYMRYTGSRMDEANRAKWVDVDLEGGWVQVQGTKTEESAEIIPLAPVLREQLLKYRERYPDSELIFPGRSYQTKDRKIYSRRRFFEKIQRLTAKVRYAQAHPEMTEWQVVKAVQAENYKGGVKLTAKDLRDVFATVVMDNVKNPDTARRLMRHTSLQTTTKYMRLVKDRMQEAVKNLGQPLEASLGGGSGGKSLRKITQSDIMRELLVKLVRERNVRENVGGGGRSRTADAADMSRVL